jgi:ubiquinone/menaquinone biosynthesis C-methylase UbiE
MSTPPAYSGTIPENYDRYLGPYIFEPYAADLVERIPAATGRVLEIACGTGRVTAHLRKRLAGAEIIATDVNEDMLAVARQRLGETGVHWQAADAQELPFGEGYFDVVVCQFGLMFVPDRPKALLEAYRVLRPGGQLLFSTWDSLENNPSFFLANELVTAYFPVEPPRFFYLPFSVYGEETLTVLARDAGFNHIRVTLIVKTGVSPSADAAAAGMLEGSPIYPQILARDAELLPVIRKGLAEGLARVFGDAPLSSRMQAWIVEARKEG